MKFGIWCEVSGGVTGSRENWLQKDGGDWVFETLSEAEKYADQLRTQALSRIVRTTEFKYTVRTYS